MEALRKIQTENETKNCLYCEAEFNFKRSNKKYCSNNCKQMAYFKRNGFISSIQNEFELGIEPKFATPYLRVIKGGVFRTDKRIGQFWLFCQAALWSNQLFCIDELEEFERLIGEHFKRFNDPDTAFLQLVERVCLAKRYVTRRSGRYIAKPMDWLNINYRNGLAGTESWYKSVADQRKTVPHYNEGVSTLSRAVLDYCIKPDISRINFYRRKLMRLKQFDMLQVYMNAIVHIQYISIKTRFDKTE